MIDTVAFSTNDFAVSDEHKLDVEPARLHGSERVSGWDNVLFRNGCGEHRGRKAMHNDDVCNVTLTADRHAYGSKPRCTVQFSAPKVTRGGNFMTADADTTRLAIERVERHLATIGIRMNARNAGLSRLDPSKRFETVESVPCYRSMFEMVHFKRTNRSDIGSTMTLFNTRFELQFYDKILEMRNRKESVAGLPSNVMTAEMRFLKHQKIVETLGFDTVDDLLENFEHVGTVYRKIMSNKVFKARPADIQLITIDGYQRELERFRDSGTRYWFKEWAHASNLQRGVSDYPALIQAVKNMELTRATRDRMVNELREGWLDARLNRVERPSTRPMGEIYDEIKTKVLAP